MNKNVLKLVILIVLIVIAVGIIGIGVVIVFGDNNQRQENEKQPIENSNKNPINEELDSTISEEQNLNEKIFYQTEKNTTKFYYRINDKNEEDDIELFTIMPEQETKEMLENGDIYDVEVVGEKNGTKYYYISRTDAVVDIVEVQEQLKNPNITDEEKEQLQQELKEYNNILDLYNKRDEIIKSFLEK